MAIDTTKLRALNLQDKKSVGDVFKPYDDRFDGKFIESDEDVDEEIILFIPFVCDVQIKSICILGGEDDKSPSTMKVWTNREDIDFSNADNIKCTQKFELVNDNTQAIDYPVNIPKFRSCANITIFFNSNFGAETSKIYYLGLKGVTSKIVREQVVIATYESSANLADHKNRADQAASSNLQ
eukprot:TRINITY_DN1209_c0_g1_i3.p1 TRINITY_DN1209_c0_g1~~TRINITY_DN1209_c0_g1_i3.p1  ORF type:complete len:182 (+),score=59.56 TRINITY_DN1209_c0_g1_i3:148-693(+)